MFYEHILFVNKVLREQTKENNMFIGILWQHHRDVFWDVFDKMAKAKVTGVIEQKKQLTRQEQIKQMLDEFIEKR